MNEQEILDRAKRAAMSVDGPAQPYDALLRRRDRKRRNQRITAGVVGIAVFVAAIWIVTSVSSLDRSEKTVVPGVSGVTGPTQIAPPPAHASAAPDKVVRTACSDIAIWRLELTDLGKTIMVRFELHRSLPGRSWWIKIRHIQLPIQGEAVYGGLPNLPPYTVEFRGRRVADSNGEVVVQQRVQDFGDASSNGSERAWNEFSVRAGSPDPEQPPPRGEFSGQGCGEVSVPF